MRSHCDVPRQCAHRVHDRAVIYHQYLRRGGYAIPNPYPLLFLCVVPVHSITSEPIDLIEGMLRAEAVTTLARSVSVSQDDLLSYPEVTKQALMQHPELTTSERIRGEYDMMRNEWPLSEVIAIFMSYCLFVCV